MKGALDEMRERLEQTLAPDQVGRIQEEFESFSEKVEDATDKLREQGSQLGKLSSLFVTLGTVTSTVAVASPVTFEKFTLTMKDLSAVVGQILQPVLERATTLFRGVADVIINLDPALKTAIANFATLTVAVKAVTASLGVSTGGLVGVLTLVVGLIASTESGAAAFRQAFSALTPAFEKLSTILSTVLEAFEPLLELLGEVAGVLVEALVPVVKILVDVLAAQAAVTSALIKAVLPFAKILLTALTPALKVMAAVLQVLEPIIGVVSGLFQRWGEIVGRLMDAVTPLAEFFLKVITPIIEQLTDEIVRLVEVIVEATTKLLEFFGLAGKADSLPGAKKSSLGAASRSADFVDTESFHKRAILAGVKASTHETKVEQSLDGIFNQTDKILQYMVDLESRKEGRRAGRNAIEGWSSA